MPTATNPAALALKFKIMKKTIITIGRQFGSGGVLVANELGKRLGFPVYDNELITKAAADSGFAKEFFARSDEKKNIFSLAGLFGIESNNYMSNSKLFEIQCETIRRIAAAGPAIIVGRCADYVLREREDILSVFLTSPLEARADRVMHRDGLSYEEALEKIARKDAAREEYYNYYTFGNWGVASTYDLCIDSSVLGIKGTADIIIDIIKRTGNDEE